MPVCPNLERAVHTVYRLSDLLETSPNEAKRNIARVFDDLANRVGFMRPLPPLKEPEVMPYAATRNGLNVAQFLMNEPDLVRSLALVDDARIKCRLDTPLVFKINENSVSMRFYKSADAFDNQFRDHVLRQFCALVRLRMLKQFGDEILKQAPDLFLTSVFTRIWFWKITRKPEHTLLLQSMYSLEHIDSLRQQFDAWFDKLLEAYRRP